MALVESGGEEGIKEQYSITGFTWESNSSMAFYTTRGDVLSIANGFSQVTTAGGDTYLVCAANATCASLSVNEADIDVDAMEAQMEAWGHHVADRRSLTHTGGCSAPSLMPLTTTAEQIALGGLTTAEKTQLNVGIKDSIPPASVATMRSGYDSLCATELNTLFHTDVWILCTVAHNKPEWKCFDFFYTYGANNPFGNRRANLYMDVLYNLEYDTRTILPNAYENVVPYCLKHLLPTWCPTCTIPGAGRRLHAEGTERRRLQTTQTTCPGGATCYDYADWLDLGVPLYHQSYIDLGECKADDYWTFACELAGFTACDVITEAQADASLVHACLFDSAQCPAGVSFPGSPCSGSGRRQLMHGNANSMCHPASSTLTLCDGAPLRLDAAAVGDSIRTPSGCEPITGLFHADAEAVGTYHKFTTKGGASVAISDDHWLFVNGAEADPATVKPGDLLTTMDGALGRRRARRDDDRARRLPHPRRLGRLLRRRRRRVHLHRARAARRVEGLRRRLRLAPLQDGRADRARGRRLLLDHVAARRVRQARRALRDGAPRALAAHDGRGGAHRARQHHDRDAGDGVVVAPRGSARSHKGSPLYEGVRICIPRGANEGTSRGLGWGRTERLDAGWELGVSWEHGWEIQIGTRALKERGKKDLCVCELELYSCK